MMFKHSFEICMLNTTNGVWETRIIQNANTIPKKGDGLLIDDSSYTVRNVVYDFNHIVDHDHIIKLYVVPGI